MRLITVTFPAHLELGADAESVRIVNEMWRRFVQKLRRICGEHEYGKTLEFTKNGRLHIHALTRGVYLPKCTDRGRRAHGLPAGPGSGSPCYCGPRSCSVKGCRAHRRPCVQALAWETGMGFVDVRKVRSPGQALGYVAKYLAKASAEERWPRYARRYSASRAWAPITLGQIHRDYIDELKHKGVIVPDPESEQAIAWCLAPPRPRLPDPPRYRPDPDRWDLNTRSGEIRPVPF